jgi:uncharacterized protein DUF4238
MGHHYVPRFYLRGFAADEALWCFDKQLRNLFSTKVGSIANENAMYSEDVESYLANKVEYPAKPAITKLRARQHLTSGDRLALAKYIVTMWKRVPKARERALARLPSVADEVQADLHAQLASLSIGRPDLVPNIDGWRDKIDSALAEQRQSPSPEIWYRSIESQAGPRVVDALLSMNWLFLESPTRQFLTGDNPVFFFEHEGIGRPTSELTFPLSSDLALWATRLPRPSMKYLDASPNGVREINRRTVHNSVRFVYARENEPWILPFVLKERRQLMRLQ